LSSPATPSPASSVDLRIASDGTDTTDTSVTLIADLGPDAAYGSVALYDGTSEIASAANYRIRWSWSTTYLDPGRHHFTVTFTPAAAAGYTASSGSADWSVPLPPTPAASVSKTADPQPVAVTIPGARPTRTTRPTPSVKSTKTTTSRPKPQPSRRVQPTQVSRGSGGPLPFTGFAAVRLAAASLLLLAVGAVLARLARRRRVSQ
jgi:hypothetical protein